MTLRAGLPGGGGYVQLVSGPGEAHVVLDEEFTDGEVLLSIAHLSDLHLCDAQSPARIEFLDRWTDPDSPVRTALGEMRTYRAHEILTTQVAAAMVAAVNAVNAGPVGGAPLDLAIATGDATDNAQANELAWYLALLDGGTVHPDAGDPSRYEGVGGFDDAFDERYWHPESERACLPRSRYGFPRVPGLHAATRRAFDSPGLDVPWLGVHGNHDEMVHGTWPGDVLAGTTTTGASKPVALEVAWVDVVALHEGIYAGEAAALAVLAQAEQRPVTPDPARRVVTRAEFVAAHHTPTARPPGHGFGDRAYYRHDHGSRVTVLALDTVNGHGGWQGSLDVEQLGWLDAELTAADRDRRYVVLASHHPLATLVNDRAPDGSDRRVLGPELETVLARHPSVVLWLNGHLHKVAITAHGTWWEITAPSLIDWPQQGRVVELLRSAGGLTVATTMLDHAGEAPWNGAIDSVPALAGLSRELAANHWQWREWPLAEHPRSGARYERNVLLPLPDPFT
ncbi:TIGR03767 family metallophosphoesterase [uncultured Jatrophihabitans sp.]|uniref:TIGR03767 family metallophosphoesterase n=1 Tax=uncultured Jatrophihabitans sp. TaxID=1610747 RepID=UPI0035CBDE60